jgi:hypothetical protein
LASLSALSRQRKTKDMRKFKTLFTRSTPMALALKKERLGIKKSSV